MRRMGWEGGMGSEVGCRVRVGDGNEMCDIVGMKGRVEGSDDFRVI